MLEWNQRLCVSSYIYLILAMSRENLSLGFLTRSDTNQAVQQQNLAERH